MDKGTGRKEMNRGLVDTQYFTQKLSDQMEREVIL